MPSFLTHRGASGYFPEHTLAAYAQAIADVYAARGASDACFQFHLAAFDRLFGERTGLEETRSP